MNSGTGVRRMRAALWARHARRHVTTVGATLGALAVVSIGLAPLRLPTASQSAAVTLDAMNAQGLWKVGARARAVRSLSSTPA